MGILDKFTNIDDLLVSLIERIGGVTEEDTHFFAYPADGTRATIAAGKTTLDFMGGTVMDTDGAVTSLGNSLRARGREYCRSLTLQGDQDIVVQIGTKSKIPIYAGLRFKVSHLRFTEVKIITTVPTEVTLIACTNADAVSIDGEIIARHELDIGNLPSDYFKADEAAVMKGADGASKREVLVDGTGIMLSRMKGAHGGVLNDIAIDSTGIMLSRMKGAHAGALSDIALDASGNMISVMKGDYAGALKTWKVDAEGRGEMFIADPVDVWGQVRQMGLAELAVRTHAPPLVFDRRGDVIRWYDFESPTEKWDTYASDASITRSNDYSNTGDFSLKCTISAVWGQGMMKMKTHDYHLGNIGLQVQFSAVDKVGRVLIMVGHYTGTTLYRYELRLELDSNSIVYTDPSGDILIDTFDFNAAPVNFSTGKLVVDLASHRAIRAIVFGKEHDLTGLACDAVVAPNLTPANLSTRITYTGNGAGLSTVYIDNVIVTENEPT